MNPLTLAKILISLLVVASGSSLALPSDRQQPIHIKSDTAEIDDATGVSVYRGKVTIDQGSIKVSADQVTIYNSDKGITKVIALGNPAHYQQQPEPDKSVMHAFGNTIDYFVTEQRIEIRKNAKLEQDKNSFTGERIDYDMKRRLVNAYSQNGDGEDNGSRVNMVLQPGKVLQPGNATQADTQDSPESSATEAAPVDNNATSQGTSPPDE